MASLNHPNVVRLLGVCFEDGADKLCIVLEFCARGSLDTMLVPAASEKGGEPWNPVMLVIALGIARCFKYLHHEQAGEAVLHRDLKPANVFLELDLKPRVGDFGESRRMDTPQSDERGGVQVAAMTIVGTPLYIAPEMLLGEAYGTPVDV